MTEPYSAGIGGGGFLVYYDARTRGSHHRRPRDGAGDVHRHDLHRPGQRPADGLRHRRQLRPVGRACRARRRSGTRPPATLRHAVAGAAAEAGRAPRRARASSSTRPSTTRPRPTPTRVRPVPGDRRRSSCRAGSRRRSARRFRNPDLAKAYRSCAPQGVGALYRGRARRGDRRRGAAPRTRHARASSVIGRAADPADLRGVPGAAPRRRSTRSTTGSTSTACRSRARGGIAVAEILNLIEAYEAQTGTTLVEPRRRQYLHRFSEASRDGLRRPQPLRRRRPAACPVDELTQRQRSPPSGPASSTRPRPDPSRSRSAPRTARYAGCAGDGVAQGRALRGPVDDPPARSPTGGATSRPTP